MPLRDDGTAALMLSLISPILSGVVLLLLVLTRVALGPLPRFLAWVVWLPQFLAAVLALRSVRTSRGRYALAISAVMALLFGWRAHGQALAWVCV